MPDQPGHDQLAVGVDRRPRPHVADRRTAPFFSAGTFFCFAPTNDQISSHWTRVTGRCGRSRRGTSAHAAPSSTSSLTIVFFATPVMRTVARMQLPSTRAATTAVRFALFSLIHNYTICLSGHAIKTFLAG